MRPLLSALLIVILAGAPCHRLNTAVALIQDGPGAGRQPVPVAAEEQRARKQIEDVFAAQLAKAEAPEQKAALAKKMLQTGVEEQKDLAAKYALFMSARDTAIRAGDVQTASASIEALEHAFDVDALGLRVDMLAAIARTAARPALKDLTHLAVALTDVAVANDRYEPAREAANAALLAARRAEDAQLVAQAAAKVREVAATEQAYKDVAKSVERLQKNPEDPAANLAVGSFRCFVKGDWEGGLPLLAAGNDPAIKAMAQQDLAGAAASDEQVKVGDAWWEAGERASEQSKRHFRARAAMWYQRAVPAASGLAKARADTRIKQVAQAAGAKEGKPQSVWLTELQPVGHTVGAWSLGINVYSSRVKAPMIEGREITQYIFAHAPSVVKYNIPKGARTFTAAGSTFASKNVVFIVKVDGQTLFRSEPLRSAKLGYIPVVVKLPPDGKVIDLVVDAMGDRNEKHSVWCEPAFNW